MKRLIALIIIILLCGTFSLVSEQLVSTKWGYSLDLPEGYAITSSQDGDRYQFDHSLFSVTLLIASYDIERFETAQAALENVYDSLQLQGDMEALLWNNEEQVVGMYGFSTSGVDYTGWAVSVLLPGAKGTTVFLCYAPSAQFTQNEQIIISTLDSIGTSQGAVLQAGILTSFAYPKEGDQQIELEVSGKKINTTIDKSDIAASEFVVQREYAILTYFANTQLWKEAWQRFYRIVYRDSYKRLQRVSFSMYNALYRDIKEAYPDDFDKELAQTLLTWVQGFEYLRIPLGTDFVPLPSIISGEGSDCDSRALLLAVLMNQMRYDTMLFVSREYSHALFGIAIEGEGARLESNGISYLLGETTAPVSIGLVPQEMSEITNWIAIDGL